MPIIPSTITGMMIKIDNVNDSKDKESNDNNSTMKESSDTNMSIANNAVDNNKNDYDDTNNNN